MRDVVDYSPPPVPCGQFVPGEPRAEPLPRGHLCGGIDGEPCHRCVKLARVVRGQAEWLAETMGYRPRGRR